MMRGPGREPSPGRPRSRGLTFIEVVVATALLVALSSVVLGTVTFMESSASREARRLEGMEVAHRLIAQYLDDKDLLPPERLPIQQGNSYYRFRVKKEVVMQEDGPGRIRRGRVVRQDEVSAEEALPQMLHRVSVSVYLDDPGNPWVDTSRPIATLIRMFNPVAGRDEDAMMKFLLEMVDRIEREQGSGTGKSKAPAPGSGTSPGK